MFLSVYVQEIGISMSLSLVENISISKSNFVRIILASLTDIQAHTHRQQII